MKHYYGLNAASAVASTITFVFLCLICRHPITSDWEGFAGDMMIYLSLFAYAYAWVFYWRLHLVTHLGLAAVLLVSIVAVAGAPSFPTGIMLAGVVFAFLAISLGNALTLGWYAWRR